MSTAPTFCGCPLGKVDWMKPGGLLDWNMPCMLTSGDDHRGVYMIDENTEAIIIPQEEILIPCWIYCTPLFGIFAMCFCPFSFSEGKAEYK